MVELEVEDPAPPDLHPGIRHEAVIGDKLGLVGGLNPELDLRAHRLRFDREDATLIMKRDVAVRRVIDLEPSVVREHKLEVVPPRGYLGPASLEVICFRSAGGGDAGETRADSRVSVTPTDTLFSMLLGRAASSTATFGNAAKPAAETPSAVFACASPLSALYSARRFPHG